ncbi:Bug family tripartite tricarboxylate transporter substrate binding protein [Bordetella genomosp. 1]|uniref:ABC transporter substrate-binding protein n=1 Tax=Bordetella genomosp. 1 TaxID=1395607 RepID=A0ABX4F3B0_9BORD|nr:tripartite tricarboxylate transporter substrate binding protein [Bordetella genomosp. 1]MDQ8035452.1 tripartite tricarboxylate transporter substrate binding protein [Bordetella sp.]OZI66059.1 ABC transporter substrate-binding protein [Bordetella genomosp. 1]
MIKRTLRAALAALLLATGASAQAAFPDRPVHIIVSNPPGGPVDVMLRVLAARLGQQWNQPVVVENRPGASGIISTSALLKAPADGYTLGMVVASTVTIVPFAVDKLPFDTQKDLQPIALVARTPFLFIVAADSPLRSWSDFVAASKQRSLTMGSFSIGTAFHLVWEQTARHAGIQALYVPSSSSGKTQSDLLGGQLDVALDAPSSAKGLIDSGRVRALAITSPQRFAGLPGTPTLAESGLPGYAPQPWIGLMAPAGVPADRALQIQQAVARVLAEPAMKAQMETLGMIPIGGTAEELARTIAADRAEMEPLIKSLGIKLQ